MDFTTILQVFQPMSLSHYAGKKGLKRREIRRVFPAFSNLFHKKRPDHKKAVEA